MTKDWHVARPTVVISSINPKNRLNHWDILTTYLTKNESTIKLM
ncbi:hypothetical protein CRENPOLYSF2_2120004 [Crenothrix polyspora]|uniref:Uncharacterized protein n=1 Tax=Crenothrix polyspora TaxID=360316 RepID=A0A1R4H4P4_9GAMM|nr:hypothetical protein CRENPOLYSF2_2120004 [Crenothrix polyspora]